MCQCSVLVGLVVRVMGVCLSLDVEERKARARSEQVDKYLQQCAEQETNIVKILLLGMIM